MISHPYVAAFMVAHERVADLLLSADPDDRSWNQDLWEARQRLRDEADRISEVLFSGDLTHRPGVTGHPDDSERAA